MDDQRERDPGDTVYGDGETTNDRDERSSGRVHDMPAAGTTPLHSLPSYADPVAENIDPTSPGSPEQTLDYQHADDDIEPPSAEHA
jgi:hypothetical protein